MKSRRKKFLIALIIFAVLVAGGEVVLAFGNDLFISLESKEPSQSRGTTGHGSLVHGKRLPTRGMNFRAYSRLGALLGRNTVNDRVRDTVLEAYADLDRDHPDRFYVYGETGWPRGGRFRPHRSHQNGLSVDFMVPVKNKDGTPSVIPTRVLNKFGYGLEFDATGEADGLRIDFDALAWHLAALRRFAARHGLRIKLVIFDQRLQPLLFKNPAGSKLRAQLPFSRHPAWIRHDEHYHVDFEPAS